LRVFAVLCVIAGLAAGPAQAQEQRETNTLSGRASASVVQPLRVAAVEDLSFGTVMLQRGQGGEIIISETGSETTYTGALHPICRSGSSCAAHRARFAVSGQNNRDYGIGLPLRLPVTGHTTGTHLSIDRLSAASAASPSLGVAGRTDDAGHDSFSVGGSLQVPAGSKADQYRGDLTVTVFYY